MNLQQAADEAMAYLDSVGVAADWSVAEVYGFKNVLIVHTESSKHYFYEDNGYTNESFKRYFSQKSPA